MKVAKRETAVLIRLSEREKRTLKRKAANYGMTVSDYARTLLINSDDATIKVIDTEPLKKAAHELAKQGTNLNQFMKFLNTYGVKVFDRRKRSEFWRKRFRRLPKSWNRSRRYEGKPTGTTSICKPRISTTSITNDRNESKGSNDDGPIAGSPRRRFARGGRLERNTHEIREYGTR